MDYGSLAMTLGILAYGVIEFRRRERRHRIELSHLRRGEVPPPLEPQHPFLTLMSTGGALALILVSALAMFIEGAGVPRYGRSIVGIGAFFLVLSFPVAAMFLRDLRAYRSRRRAERSAR